MTPPQTVILHVDYGPKLIQNSFNFQQEDYKRLQKKYFGCKILDFVEGIIITRCYIS